MRAEGASRNLLSACSATPGAITHKKINGGFKPPSQFTFL